jgi:hypothetical protein
MRGPAARAAATLILRLASKGLDEWVSRPGVGDNDALAYVECYLRREWSLATTGLQGLPYVLHPHATCLDFSVANDGFLTTYRWSGESELRSANLVWVPA